MHIRLLSLHSTFPEGANPFIGRVHPFEQHSYIQQLRTFASFLYGCVGHKSHLACYSYLECKFRINFGLKRPLWAKMHACILYILREKVRASSFFISRGQKGSEEQQRFGLASSSSFSCLKMKKNLSMVGNLNLSSAILQICISPYRRNLII